MRIERLTRDLIPVVTRGGNQALVAKLTSDFNLVTSRGGTVWVRYGPNWLQWVCAPSGYLDTPGDLAMIEDERFWITVDGYEAPEGILLGAE